MRIKVCGRNRKGSSAHTHVLVRTIPTLLLTLLPEKFVEIVEDLGTARQTLIVIRGCSSDAVDQRPNADCFGAPELVVPQINIVNNLGDRAQRGILLRNSAGQDLEGAVIALVRELRLE